VIEEHLGEEAEVLAIDLCRKSDVSRTTVGLSEQDLTDLVLPTVHLKHRYRAIFVDLITWGMSHLALHLRKKFGFISVLAMVGARASATYRMPFRHEPRLHVL
jgi:hypothetical protein